MYNISHFKEPERSRILNLMADNPFAFLTGSFKNGRQVATQIPLLIEQREDELILLGHIMRNTDHHRAFIDNPIALAVFTGPHTYVSAKWYSSPNVGSTWNYMSVHASGEVVFMDDEELINFMKKLTLHFEGGDAHSPTFYDNLSQDYVDKMMGAIVGFEIEVKNLNHVFKLSQNKDKQTYQNIIKHLEFQEGDGAKIAAEMKKRENELF
ncbi:MAG: FMN-binding negative transcriptional regulator [Balneolaceae bacterium]|nr:FMN-binding negative transcriptional regulator [Balneolaceae bacterium]